MPCMAPVTIELTFLSLIEVEIKGFESFTLKNTKNSYHGNSFLVRSLKIELALPSIIRTLGKNFIEIHTILFD